MKIPPIGSRGQSPAKTIANNTQKNPSSDGMQNGKGVAKDPDDNYQNLPS